MIKRAYIHEYGNGKLEPEHADVADVLRSRGIRYELFTEKKLLRNQLELDGNTLVVGDNPVIAAVLKRIGYDVVHDSYPKSVTAYLGRQVWATTIHKLRNEVHQRETINMFIKPKSRTKLFTGFVVHAPYDLFRIESHSKDTELYCSEVVSWLSEYRVFITDGKIAGIKHYAGDVNLELDMRIVERAVADLENSQERTAAYGIDFGILDNGKTCLVEWNDGFALGSYGLEKELYTDLLIARWEEIVRTAFAARRNASEV